MLGKVGLLNAEFGLKGAGGEFAVPEDLDNGNAGGMGKRLEDSSLISPQLIGHNIRVFESSNFRKCEIEWTRNQSASTPLYIMSFSGNLTDR